MLTWTSVNCELHSLLPLIWDVWGAFKLKLPNQFINWGPKTGFQRWKNPKSRKSKKKRPPKKVLEWFKQNKKCSRTQLFVPKCNLIYINILFFNFFFYLFWQYIFFLMPKKKNGLKNPKNSWTNSNLMKILKKKS